MMRALSRLSRSRAAHQRGVTLIEGLISTVILLTGMVGILQGLAVASVQNSMANRHTRASTIAQQLISAIEQQGRARLLASTPAGLFHSSNCSTTLPTAVAPFVGDLVASPPSFTGSLGWSTVTYCYIDFDSRSAAFLSLTPGYTAQDDNTYQRLIAVYQRPSNPEVMYVGVNVGWRDGGRVRIVKRFTAIYDTATNQTNLEF